MAKYKFTSNLSTYGIEKLKGKLQDYKTYKLPRKVEQLVRELVEVGAEKAKVEVGESPLGKYVRINVKVDSEKGLKRGYIISTGDVWESEGYEPFNVMLAVEFGAGIHYNKKGNPKAPEFGLGVGTFPGQTHALDENGWWFFDEKTETWKHSYGVKATMPMYQADVEIIKQYKKIVQKVKNTR